jgi:hypothetical protein
MSKKWTGKASRASSHQLRQISAVIARANQT